MLRPAVAADLPKLIAICDGSGDDALSDPMLIHKADLRRLIASGSVTVWDEAGIVAGFAALESGAIHLLVDTMRRSRGVGRTLLDWACGSLRRAGHAKATITLAHADAAQRHYLAAGWRVAGRSTAGGTVLKKPL
jgi:GNAT superfamily N-acetyltransferase